MQIIESFLLGKRGDESLTEDGLFIGEDFIAVIDGVTPKGRKMPDGRSTGRYARDQCMEMLRNLPPLRDPVPFFSALSRAVKTDRSSPEDRPRAAVIAYSREAQEVWSYGDCSCRIGGTLFRHEKEIDRLNADLRAFVIEHALLAGLTLEEIRQRGIGREAILPNLLRQFDFENRPGPFGYGVLNGDRVEPAFIKRYPVKAGDTVILASDGYPDLRETLLESEQALSQLLEEDPLCFRAFRACKGVEEGAESFDDRAYVRFVIAPGRQVRQGPLDFMQEGAGHEGL